MPVYRRSRVDWEDRSAPASSMDPVAPGRIPMIDSTSSAWPLPSTPAMPRTSPLWMSKLMSSSSGRASGPGQAEVRDGEQDRLGHRRGLGAGRGQLGADHELGELACG